MTDDEMLRKLAKSGEPWPEPLRGEHELYPVEGKGSETICGRCGAKGLPYCLRHDLEAVVLAVGAAGYSVVLFENDSGWGALLYGNAPSERIDEYGYGPTPLSAAIRALYAAKGG